MSASYGKVRALDPIDITVQPAVHSRYMWLVAARDILYAAGLAAPTRLPVRVRECVRVLVRHHRRDRGYADHRPALDHLIALLVSVIATDSRSRPERTRRSEGIGFLGQSALGHIMIIA